MPEGLSATEVGKELGEHAKRAGEHADHSSRNRLISIVEAVLLAAVTITAAWSGYSAAKWGTEASLDLAKASTTRTKANRAFQGSLIFRVGDATTFNAWFAAYIAGDRNAARVAVKRFRPEYKVAFDAWIATHPFTNRSAPKGPQFMPQYKPTGAAESKALDATADVYFEKGQKAAETGDRYVRTTVVLASVLFLIGIGSHFPLRGVRYGLIGVGAVLLAVAAVLIVLLPPPP